MLIEHFYNPSVYMDESRQEHAAHLERHARKAEACIWMLASVVFVVMVVGGLFA